MAGQTLPSAHPLVWLDLAAGPAHQDQIIRLGVAHTYSRQAGTMPSGRLANDLAGPCVVYGRDRREFVTDLHERFRALTFFLRHILAAGDLERDRRLVSKQLQN